MVESLLLSKNMKIKMHRTEMLPVLIDWFANDLSNCGENVI